jgi:hypothetical protein
MAPKLGQMLSSFKLGTMSEVLLQHEAGTPGLRTNLGRNPEHAATEQSAIPVRQVAAGASGTERTH